MGVDRRELVARDGTTLSYLDVAGDGPVVVLLHGLAGSGRELLPTAQALAGRRVLVLDQRGHGRSTTRPADVSRAAFVSDVVELVEREAAGAVDLVGQSTGGHTAMLVAAARPDLVRRLVLLEVDQGGATPEDVAGLAGFFRSWPVPFADEAAALTALGDSPLARSWIADLERRPDGLRPRFDADVMAAVATAVAEPRWAEWASVRAPTLLVYADGGMFSPESKDAFTARGHDVVRLDLRDASHDAHLDAFEAWVSAVRDFLQGPPPG